MAMNKNTFQACRVKRGIMNRLLCTFFLLGIALGCSVSVMAQIPPVLDQTGYTTLLEENKGKVVAVDFWASWCGPCRKKVSELNKCRQAFSEEQVTVIGISLDFNPDALTRFLAANPVQYPVYWAEENLAAQLEVQAIPLLFIYDARGRKVHTEEGLSSQESICTIINHQLNP
ncbi:MAG TPA: TlpA family protein disulfide reductase [Desulfonatronum sp.]|nr:TlpA family protein disulfide reductase [Desulfonatronum sp.]